MPRLQKKTICNSLKHKTHPHTGIMENMVYRKTIDGPWICSWNCGYKHYDIKKMVEHENKGEC